MFLFCLQTFLGRERYTSLQNNTRCELYTDLIDESSTDQRKLFRITKSLLREPCEVSFPKHIFPADLANSFGHYFVQKIDTINKSLDDPTPSLASEAGDGDCTALDGFAAATFTDLKAVTEEQVADLIRSVTKTSCPLDPMPTSVVLEVIDVLLPVITNMINLSFESSKFALAWKKALVRPLLKKVVSRLRLRTFA